jgi:hypothetical protein
MLTKNSGNYMKFLVILHVAQGVGVLALSRLRVTQYNIEFNELNYVQR